MPSDLVNLEEYDAAGAGQFRYMSSKNVGASAETMECTKLAGRGAMAIDPNALLKVNLVQQELLIPM
jgi:hypothetical protein